MTCFLPDLGHLGERPDEPYTHPHLILLLLFWLCLPHFVQRSRHCPTSVGTTPSYMRLTFHGLVTQTVTLAFWPLVDLLDVLPGCFIWEIS